MAYYLKKANEKEENENGQTIYMQVAEIISNVKNYGDSALIKYNKELDNFTGDSLLVTKSQIEKAYELTGDDVVNSIKFAAKNIQSFANAQKEMMVNIETEIMPGVVVGHNIIPIESCACYVPGGRYPLPSSALMSIIPAKTAGVKRVAACSPPLQKYGQIHPATLVAMDIAGADEIYCMGGAHAVAAFAYGTESVKNACIISGPGNRYVTEAKRQVYGAANIDFLAGPSEVFIIADNTANSDFIAADLLAQSEHDTSARGILACTSEKLAKEVLDKVAYYVKKIDTGETASAAWENNGMIIVCESLSEAVKIANETAPEHLELHVVDPYVIKKELFNYGSLFIGEYSAEVFGDYSSGTNHILPTFKAARYTGGVWVGTFLKTVSYQHISKSGAEKIGYPASILAKTEGLAAHKLASDLRLNG